MLKLMARIASVATTSVLVSTPFIALADTVVPGQFANTVTDPDFSRAAGIVQGIGGLVNMLIPIAIAAALLFFIWGLAQFIMNSGDPEKKSEGKNRMIHGIITLFVIVSIWGIIAWIGSTLGIGKVQLNQENLPIVDVNNQIPGVNNTRP